MNMNISEDLNDSKLKERLNDSPLLITLTVEQIERFLSCGIIERFNDGEIIVREGEFGDALYLILNGKVSINSREGKELTSLSSDTSLQAQYEGDFFGELSILDLENRSADVKAVNNLVLFKISREDLYSIFASDVDFQVVFLMNLSRILSRRLRRSNIRRLEDEA